MLKGADLSGNGRVTIATAKRLSPNCVGPDEEIGNVSGNREPRVATSSTSEERSQLQDMAELIRGNEIPDGELLQNLGLFLNRQNFSRLLFVKHLYEQVVNIQGDIFEFGVRWGQNLAAFSVLRGILEPYNHSRRLVGFDTFEGFPDGRGGVSPEDGSIWSAGDLSVVHGWREHLNAILDFHNQNNPIGHISKHELVAGDVVETLPEYLGRHPETIVALAYFDLDLYEPTRASLEMILPHVPRGGILVFDELNTRHFPGETRAVREVLDLTGCTLRRFSLEPSPTYVILGS